MKATLSRTSALPGRFNGRSAGWTFGRIVSVVMGSVLVLVAIGLITAGGYLASAATSDGGWVALGHGRFETTSYAVTTEPVDWSTQSYVLGTVDKVRIRVTPQDATTPVFVGMGPTDAVDSYLNGIQYVTAHGGPNYQVTYAQHDGHAPTTPPEQAVPWSVQATGTGTQTLEFDAQEQQGDQVLVVMNADGSQSVSGLAESAVTQPSLPWVYGSLLVAGAAAGVVAFFLIVKPIRRARGRA